MAQAIAVQTKMNAMAIILLVIIRGLCAPGEVRAMW